MHQWVSMLRSAGSGSEDAGGVGRDPGRARWEWHPHWCKVAEPRLLLSAMTASLGLLRPAATIASARRGRGAGRLVSLLSAVLEAGDRVLSAVVGADAGDARGGTATAGSAWSGTPASGSTVTSGRTSPTRVHSHGLGAGLFLLLVDIDLGELETRACISKGGNGSLQNFGLQFVFATEPIKELESEVIIAHRMTDVGEIVSNVLKLAGVGGDGEITPRGGAKGFAEVDVACGLVVDEEAESAWLLPCMVLVINDNLYGLMFVLSYVYRCVH